MALALDIATGLLLAVGSAFYLIGAFGLVRMPEVFTRLHAASVMETLGAGSLLFGMMIAAGWSLNTAKLAIILGILLYTGPIATHALARAALTAGLRPNLAEDRTAPAKKAAGRRRRKATKGGKPSKR